MPNVACEPDFVSRVQQRRPGTWVVWILFAFSMLYYSLHCILARDQPINRSTQEILEQGRDSWLAIDDWCPLVDAIEPPGDDVNDSLHFMTLQHQKIQAERLSQAVRIPTESFDDNGEVDQDPRWKTFDQFHQVLEELFPLVYACPFHRAPKRMRLADDGCH